MWSYAMRKLETKENEHSSLNDAMGGNGLMD